MGNYRDGEAVLNALTVAASLRRPEDDALTLVDQCCARYRDYPDLEFDSGNETWECGPVGRLLAEAFAPGVDLLMFHEAPADPVAQERWDDRAWDEWFARVNDPWHARYGWG